MDNDHGKKRSLGIVQKKDFLFPFVLFILSFFSSSFQRYVIMGQDYFCLFAFFFLLIGASQTKLSHILWESKVPQISLLTVGPFIIRLYICLYIYIYIYDWIQVTPSVTLSNITSLNIFYLMRILRNPPLNYIIFIYSPYLQNFKVIKE